MSPDHVNIHGDIDRDGMVVDIQRQIKTVTGVTMLALPRGGKARMEPIATRCRFRRRSMPT